MDEKQRLNALTNKSRTTLVEVGKTLTESLDKVKRETLLNDDSVT